MKVEQNVDLDQRARLHAALADPTRLAIVDVLALGDASPSELQAVVDVPSNLLAHHINVLDSAGLIERGRSEADRRRTYLRLMPRVLALLTPRNELYVSRVVFVCSANSARSQLSAALWRRASRVPTASAGTHPAARIDPRAIAAARRHRLPLRAARPRALPEVASGDDFVITVCDSAHEEIAARAGLHWSIPDPVRVGREDAFDAAYDELDRRISALAPLVHASWQESR